MPDFIPELKDINTLSFEVAKTRLNATRCFLEELSDVFCERRTDVSELADAFLTKGKALDRTAVEKRFIRANLDKITVPDGYVETEVEYDTLTTEISFAQNLVRNSQDKCWKQAHNHEYRDA